MFNSYRRLQKRPADRFLKTVIIAKYTLVEVNPDLVAKQEKLSDLDSYSEESFRTDIESIYSEKISNHIGKLK